MSTSSAPRRRRPSSATDGQIILLGAPEQPAAPPLSRADSHTSSQVAPISAVAPTDQRSMQQAVYTARQAWVALADRHHPAPAVPLPAPRRGRVAAGAAMIRQRAHAGRRYTGHLIVLMLACVLALNGGFPLHPRSVALEADATAALAPDDPHAGSLQRVVIPVSATRVQRLPRREAEPEAPALIRPVTQNGPAFVATHTVHANETLAEIAATYNISADSLVAANDLRGVLAIGEQLRIPRISGVPHVVREGETLSDIASRYNVPSENIMAYSPNRLDHGQALVVGNEIFIPNGSLAIGGVDPSARGDVGSMKAQAVAIVRDDKTNLREGPGTDYERVIKLNAGDRVLLLARHADWAKIQQLDGAVAWMSHDVIVVADDVWAGLAETDDFPPPPPPPPVWVWPTWGDLTSGFGYRNFSVGAFHNGIDIANRRGTSIVAARSGRVIEAGWCSGYGYCVKISHGDGIVTEYGHMMSNPVVDAGQHVDAGELIGYMGSTYDRAGGGYSTGNHLHFTVKVDGTAVSPYKFLP